MAHFHNGNDSNYYSQSNLIQNMNGLSMNNNSSSTTIMSSSAPSFKSNRLPPRPSEEWKRTSVSVSPSSDWKTSSSKPKQMESWKMSGKPRHAQLANIQQQTEPDLKRQSAPIYTSWQNPKPLPIEPIVVPIEPINVMHVPPIMNEEPHYTTHISSHPPFHVAVTPMQQPAYIHQPPQEFYTPQNYPPPTFINGQQEFNNNYSTYNASFVSHQEYPTYHHNEYPPPTTEHNSMIHYPPPSNEHNNMIHQPPPIETTQQQSISLQDPPVPKTPPKSTKKKDSAAAKPEKKVRQITVQSINAEHRVWIDVLPAETGLSLAEKIHIIATFRTRKIVSIETASGRKIPLDNRPVFGSWMDMESFEDGERWNVEWRENDRGVVDRFMSKIVQAGGGKRSKDHVAKD